MGYEKEIDNTANKNPTVGIKRPPLSLYAKYIPRNPTNTPKKQRIMTKKKGLKKSSKKEL